MLNPTVEWILARLPAYRETTRGYRAHCPVCHGRPDVLLIQGTRTGGAYVRCFAACNTRTVLVALGLQLSDLQPDRSAV
jgi:formate dehydrogenase maturation protein FdhE